MLWNRSYIIAMYSREAVIALLDARHLWYELTEHRAVNTMEEASDLTLPYPEREAKNLFLHDDRRRSWHLVSIMGGRRLDLKAFRKEEGLRPLSFASPDELMEHLGLTPGSVTPFGVLNDEARSVVLHLDSSFWQGSGIIGLHPNDNRATVWMRTADLADLLTGEGHEVVPFSVPEL